MSWLLLPTCTWLRSRPPWTSGSACLHRCACCTLRKQLCKCKQQAAQFIAVHSPATPQNIWLKGTGAYTGEVPGELLQDLGVQWTLTGHSERRSLCGETNEVVGLKTARALELGMSVIPCIGETLEQRNSGELFKVLDAQIQALVNVSGCTHSLHGYGQQGGWGVRCKRACMCASLCKCGRWEHTMGYGVGVGAV